jgi:hypothetical protein
LAAPGTVTAARRATRSFNRVGSPIGARISVMPRSFLAQDGLYEKAQER